MTTNRLIAVQPEQDRSPLGAPWWIAVLVVPLLLAALSTAVRGGPIEDDLTTRTAAALDDAGLLGVDVDFSGRDATLTVPASVNGDEAIRVVEGVEGVRTVTLGDARAAATPTAPGELAPFTIERTGRTLTVTATVPSGADKIALLSAAERSGAEVVDDVTVRGDTAAVPPEALAMLAGLQADAKAEFDGETLTLTGTVPSERARKATMEAARSLLPDAEIDNQLMVH